MRVSHVVSRTLHADVERLLNVVVKGVEDVYGTRITPSVMISQWNTAIRNTKLALQVPRTPSQDDLPTLCAIPERTILHRLRDIAPDVLQLNAVTTLRRLVTHYIQVTAQSLLLLVRHAKRKTISELDLNLLITLQQMWSVRGQLRDDVT